MKNIDFEKLEENTYTEFMPSLGYNKLYGTLDISGNGSYYLFLVQKRRYKTWVITDKDIFKVENKSDKTSSIVAVIKSNINGTFEGYGKTYLLTRLMSLLSDMVYLSINHRTENRYGFSCELQLEEGYIKYNVTEGGSNYTSLDLSYEGFNLSISTFNRPVPFKLPKLLPVQDEKSTVAVVANLGIKTATALFREKGEALDWYKSKRYKLIDSDEKFKAMMLDFLRAVSVAAQNNKTVLVGLDTETTGLKMYNLSSDNPYKDHIVAIPFSWVDDEAYLICTDMAYFGNVDNDLIYPLFDKLFSRNSDFSFQDISIDYEGEHFEFNRKNITVSGWNVMFDERAFFTEDCHVFFDEDGRQIFFNLDTDFVQGAKGREETNSFKISNSLKAQTRRNFGAETLELDELFGPKHEDKFRYLQDEQLALIYGGADADFTRLCVRKGKSLLEPILYQQYRKYDMTIMYKLAEASFNGMPVDSEAVRSQGELVKQDLNTLKEFIYHYAWLANRNTLQDKFNNLYTLFDDEDIISIDKHNDKMFKYIFTPANHKRLLFGLLKYPVISKSESTGEPSLDKFVLQKLMQYKRDNPVEIMLEDVMSVADPTVKLIDKDMFNSDAYPLARIFSTYATYNKEYTSYYKPIFENDMEGKMFYDFTMARAATRRILSPGQTMKGSLKSLVIAPPGQIFMSFDASQIEYRHMASMAYIRDKKLLQQQYPDDWEERLKNTSVAQIHEMMRSEEADYHIETAAALTGVKRHEVTPKVRKQYKSIGFGIPYGLGDRALCENLFKEVNEENMKQTIELLNIYKTKQKSIIDLLESARSSAFVPADINDDYKKYLGVDDKTFVGIVKNFVGFYRIFVLENLTRSRTARIKRQAGNCIIQGGAAELFRRMLYNFHIGCCKYGIENKIHWIMTVHDELDATVDADIDIMLLIKVLYENCTLRYNDHIPYYIGINFGVNWYDAKADANELPVIMVQRMIQAYDKGYFSIPNDGNQSNYLLALKKHYMCDRIKEELKLIYPNLSTGHVWNEEEANNVSEYFGNYVVRSYLDAFSNKHELVDKLNDWQSVRDNYGFDLDFLSEKLGENNKSKELIISDDFSLDIELSGMDLDLFDNSSEEEDVLGDWFGEGNLFDENMSADDILIDGYNQTVFFNDKNEDADFYINENPTNAFDVYVSNKYIRTKVLKVKDSTFSVILTGTKYHNDVSSLKKQIIKRFSSGNDSLMVIGNTIFRLNNIECNDEDLDWLDKLICGE